MNGREDKHRNNLFFVCSLVEYIARRTKNQRNIIVNAMKQSALQHYYELADVYHSENIDQIADEIIAKHAITTGNYDNIAEAHYKVPTHWEIGRVFQRLVTAICNNQQKQPIEALIAAFNSPIADKIEDYNSSMYYENPDYIYASYLNNRPL